MVYETFLKITFRSHKTWLCVGNSGGSQIVVAMSYLAIMNSKWTLSSVLKNWFHPPIKNSSLLKTWCCLWSLRKQLMLLICSAIVVLNEFELKESLAFFLNPHIMGCIFWLFSFLSLFFFSFFILPFHPPFFILSLFFSLGFFFFGCSSNWGPSDE